MPGWHQQLPGRLIYLVTIHVLGSGYSIRVSVTLYFQTKVCVLRTFKEKMLSFWDVSVKNM